MLVKKILGILIGWICSIVLISFVIYNYLKIEFESYLVGLSVIAWPIILFIIYIIKTVVDYINKKDIKLSIVYRIVLAILALITKERGLFSISEFIFEVVIKNIRKKTIMILNILMYMVTICLLLFVGLSTKLNDFNILNYIILMYVILLIIPFILFLINTRKARKEFIDGLAKGANISKTKLIIITFVAVLIFIIPFGILGIIRESIETKLNDNNYKYIQNKLNKKDYEVIEKEISNTLNGEIVYEELKIEENLKNEYGEVYNRITLLANLVTDKDDENSYYFIFDKYLTSSDKHEIGEIEAYVYYKSSAVLKKHWNKIK